MQINSNYSMNGVSYETRHKQNNIPQFSTECAVQKNENINPYMAEADFDEKAFDMIGPNTPRDVRSKILTGILSNRRRIKSAEGLIF